MRSNLKNYSSFINYYKRCIAIINIYIMKKKKEILRHYICTKMSYRTLHFLIKRNLLKEYIDICLKLDKAYGWYTNKDSKISYSVSIYMLVNFLANDTVKSDCIFRDDKIFIKWCSIWDSYKNYLIEYQEKIQCLPLSVQLSPRYY